jgi:hypothetical protein
MITLHNPSIQNQSEKAYSITFTGYTTPETKIMNECHYEFPQPITEWFPKSFIKIEAEKIKVKETRNFWLQKEIEIAKKLKAIKDKSELENGVIFNGINFKVKKNGNYTFSNNELEFTVGFKAKEPKGYYEQHRYCKGEDNFGYVFFIKNISLEKLNEIKRDLFDYLNSKFEDFGYGNKYMLQTEQGWHPVSIGL